MCGHSLGHNLGVEHHGQYPLGNLHSVFPASGHEPLLGELRQELVLAVVMVNAVAEPHALHVTLKLIELLDPFGFGLLAFDFVQLLARTTDTQVIPSVLVEQDIASPQCRLAQAVQQRLLLQTQTVKLRHVIAEDLKVIEFIHVVLESLFVLFLARAQHCYRCQGDKQVSFHNVKKLGRDCTRP